ncbi:MAG TPA: HD domain-containing protein [Patescibacteria group bacterium]|nr:HD domain-containing protein [Patescibacteria group bacterium]
MLMRAMAFAAEKHRHQRRRDAKASPYINHPIALASLLANEGGVEDVTVLCAAILHDTVEDTETTREELAQLFGADVAAIVMEVTNDPALSRGAQKQAQIDHAPHLSPGAKLVKLADKISNLSDILESPPDWPVDRKQAYFDQAAQVVDGLRGVSPALETVFDSVMQRRAELESRRA